MEVTISDQEFSQIRAFIYEQAGIHLAPTKKPMVASRLAKRLRYYKLAEFGDYYRLATSVEHAAEKQIMLNLLTTNETYFFREPAHFDFLRDRILPALTVGTRFRAWSAACSSGEEAYSIAMMLADRLQGTPWEIVGSDISTRVLEKARVGHYPLERVEHIPRGYLSEYCLKGVRSQENTFLIDRGLRGRVSFMQANLNGQLPGIGVFDVIFLRNVIIYFDADTKRRIVDKVVSLLKPGGHLFIGHSETMNGISDKIRMVQPTVYRKP